MSLLKDETVTDEPVITDDLVRQANRDVYNAKSVDGYNQNESIFSAAQRQRIGSILQHIADTTQGERFLDVGCGTGNLLLLARGIFERVFGVDQAEQLLAEVQARENLTTLVAGSAHQLPLADESFDGVGMYALLHHMMDPAPALEEAFRVLRPGGVLYTDHDPNFYFGRFYRRWYNLRYHSEHGFGSELEDLAEYHNVHTPGIDPEQVGERLRAIGFSDVEVKYRHSTNQSFRGARRFAMSLLRTTARVLPFASLYTHFYVLARK